jgi:hypothetical protein
MTVLYGRAVRVTTKNGGCRPGQCFYHLVGCGRQTLETGFLQFGWVEHLEGLRWSEEEGLHRVRAEWDERIGLGTRYVTATYFVMNALNQRESTDPEKVFALVQLRCSSVS